MVVKNSEIFSLVESIGEHFRTNISNRFIRKALHSINLEAGQWELIEGLTEKSDNFKYQGYHIDELYHQILALAKLVHQARRDILPNIRYMAQSGPASAMNDADKIYREMAVMNFGSNLKILADQLNVLYFKAVQIDKEASPASPTYARLPELQDLGRYLVE
jgi:hypothetical protein